MPEGWMKIAKRFNAGIAAKHVQVPEVRSTQLLFKRPYGTRPQRQPPPALKRRAIFACPYGTGPQDGPLKSEWHWTRMSALRALRLLRQNRHLELGNGENWSKLGRILGIITAYD